ERIDSVDEERMVVEEAVVAQAEDEDDVTHLVEVRLACDLLEEAGAMDELDALLRRHEVHVEPLGMIGRELGNLFDATCILQAEALEIDGTAHVFTPLAAVCPTATGSPFDRVGDEVDAHLGQEWPPEAIEDEVAVAVELVGVLVALVGFAKGDAQVAILLAFFRAWLIERQPALDDLVRRVQDGLQEFRASLLFGTRSRQAFLVARRNQLAVQARVTRVGLHERDRRSEEHTSELQSR